MVSERRFPERLAAPFARGRRHQAPVPGCLRARRDAAPAPPDLFRPFRKPPALRGLSSFDRTPEFRCVGGNRYGDLGTAADEEGMVPVPGPLLHPGTLEFDTCHLAGPETRRFTAAASLAGTLDIRPRPYLGLPYPGYQPALRTFRRLGRVDRESSSDSRNAQGTTYQVIGFPGMKRTDRVSMES